MLGEGQINPYRSKTAEGEKKKKYVIFDLVRYLRYMWVRWTQFVWYFTRRYRHWMYPKFGQCIVYQN